MVVYFKIWTFLEMHIYVFFTFHIAFIIVNMIGLSFFPQKSLARIVCWLDVQIINICYSIPFVSCSNIYKDSLFKNLVPPVILDDPFVNLDAEKIPKALELIKKMAERNQIIYFACHKSRFIQ